MNEPFEMAFYSGNGGGNSLEVSRWQEFEVADPLPYGKVTFPPVFVWSREELSSNF